MTINSNFREETAECGMKIIIQDFKIWTNNDKIHLAESIIKKHKEVLVFGGRYINNNHPYRVPHVYMINSKRDRFGLTSSKYVKALNSNCSIKTNECGLQPSGKKQYSIQFIEDDGFQNRFESHTNFTRKNIKDFDIDYKNKFIGAKMQKSILISSQDVTQAIVNGELITRIDKRIEKTINLNPEQIEIIEKFSNEEMGIMCTKKMNIEDLFYSQRRFYDKVEKPKYKEDYYDI